MLNIFSWVSFYCKWCLFFTNQCTFNALVDNGAKILINQVIKVDSMNGAPRWLTFSQSLVSNEYIDLIH